MPTSYTPPPDLPPDQQTKFLSDALAELSLNFDAAIDLSLNIIKSFHPLLGFRTKAILDLCLLTEPTQFYSQEELHNLTVATKLQFIGLVSIPRDLFLRTQNEPFKVSKDEWNAFHKHPIVASDLISHLTKKFATIASTIRHAHEHWDGSGYPDGLQRENIPRLSRFLAIANFYVESSLPPQKIVDQINSLSGIHFHPETVRLFNKIIQLSTPPQNVKELLLSELSPGMKLALPITTPNGLLLVPENTTLSESILNHIRYFDVRDPLTCRLLVFLDSIPPPQ